MFEGDSADRKFLIISMRGRVEGPVCADPGTRTLMGVSENFSYKHAELGSQEIFLHKESFLISHLKWQLIITLEWELINHKRNG